MKPSAVETWVWVLIYGGLLVLVFGLALRSREPLLGVVFVAGGAVVAGVGALLVWIRSRMTDGGDR